MNFTLKIYPDDNNIDSVVNDLKRELTAALSGDECPLLHQEGKFPYSKSEQLQIHHIVSLSSGNPQLELIFPLQVPQGVSFQDYMQTLLPQLLLKVLPWFFDFPYSPPSSGIGLQINTSTEGEDFPNTSLRNGEASA